MALEQFERAAPPGRIPPASANIGPAEWSLRDEIFAATQRWYWIVLCCLVGGLLGWLAAQVWPSPHRVSKELFVGLSVYQAGDDHNGALHSGIPFANANDYKNWQMASLNVIVFMDPVLDETINRLRLADPYWNAVERDELAGMLHAYWRNAGKWRLVAEHDNQLHATQAVLLWQDVVVEQVHTAVAEARNVMFYDLQLKTTADTQAAAADRTTVLIQAQERLKTADAGLAALPAADALSDSERFGVLETVNLDGEISSWTRIETAFPPSGSPVSAYRDWLASVDAALQAEIATAQARYQRQADRYAELSEQYALAAQASLGLSGELIVQKVSDRRLSATEVRPSGEAVLIGAGLGLIVWGLIWLVRPASRLMRRERDRHL